MTTAVEREVIAQIRERGPLRYDEVVDLALYHPTHGFYASGGSAGGSDGDFLTSPEVGPLFGAVMARALDVWWRELGEPDPFTVIEAGAGRGALARTVIEAEPACLDALTYVLVERSVALRERHSDHLVIGGTRPRVESLAELPTEPITGVVCANELIDNLVFRLVEFVDDHWFEVRVGVSDDDDGRVEESLVSADDELSVAASRLIPEPVDGTRIPVQYAAGEWLRSALDLVRHGRVVVIDYGDTTSSLASRSPDEWLRTFRRHQRGGQPLESLGMQDLTCEMAIDQLETVRAPTSRRRQLDFLSMFGIEALVDEGRVIWHERAHLGDLTAMKMRSRVREAEALTDPNGLGAFWVVEWEI